MYVNMYVCMYCMYTGGQRRIPNNPTHNRDILYNNSNSHFVKSFREILNQVLGKLVARLERGCY